MLSEDSTKRAETKVILKKAEEFDVYDNVQSHNYAVPKCTIYGALLTKTKRSKQLTFWVDPKQPLLENGTLLKHKLKGSFLRIGKIEEIHGKKKLIRREYDIEEI
jgi:uncharacterized protein YlaN (UPF0358 family)